LEALETIYQQFDDMRSLSTMKIKQSYSFASEFYEEMEQRLNEMKSISGKEFPDSGIILLNFELLTVQKELNDNSFLNLSLYDTVSQLIQYGKEDIALKMKKRFKISEKKYCYMKIKGLSKAENYYELESFGLSKMPAVGFEPLIDVLIEGDQFTSAETFIKKLKDLSEKVNYYLKIGFLILFFNFQRKPVSAFEVAKKDKDLLLRIRNHFSSPKNLQESIDKILKK
jgi:hypothetical protein